MIFVNVLQLKLFIRSNEWNRLFELILISVLSTNLKFVDEEKQWIVKYLTKEMKW